ncbi:hypothetical protein Tco_0583927 [Tanacetum coccineum]
MRAELTTGAQAPPPGEYDKGMACACAHERRTIGRFCCGSSPVGRALQNSDRDLDEWDHYPMGALCGGGGPRVNQRAVLTFGWVQGQSDQHCQGNSGRLVSWGRDRVSIIVTHPVRRKQGAGRDFCSSFCGGLIDG